MPIIKVWGIGLAPAPQDGLDTEQLLGKLRQALAQAVTAIRALDLEDPSDVTVLIPADMSPYGLVNDIVIEVDGLFMKRKRTRKVRSALAQSLADTFWEWDRRYSKLIRVRRVECFVRPFNPVEGFAVRTRTAEGIPR